MASRAFALAVLWLLQACAPQFDWRQVRPEGLGIEAQFPCRPASHARTIKLTGQALTMTMQACTVAGMTFGIASADVADVGRIDEALKALASAAAANIGATMDEGEPHLVPGMTPQRWARRIKLDGRLPDGRPLTEHVAVFAYGSRVYQATALGASPDLQAVDTFFGALAIRP